MSATTFPLAATLTADDVLRDLESGRSTPLRPADRLLSLAPRPHPALGGRTFMRTWLTARTLGRVNPRWARPALERLWFTPWVHPSALRPVTDLADDLVPWSLPFEAPGLPDGVLHGFAGGEGPTVVLVHGWAGRAADWRHLAHELIESGHRVVAPDLPAHGMTAGDQVDLFVLGEATAAVLRAEQPTAVVAHSLGFPMVMLALEAGAPEPPTIVALAPGRKASHAVPAFARRARLRPALLDELRAAIQDRFGDDVWEVLDVDRTVPSLSARGVVIHDRGDDEVPLADGEAIAERWSGASLVTTAGLGHRRVLRDPAVLAEVVATVG